MNRKCPHCGKMVDWKAQIVDWVDNYGEDFDEWATMMVLCDHCSNYVEVIDFTEEKIKHKLIKAKGFKKKIAIPKI